MMLAGLLPPLVLTGFHSASMPMAPAAASAAAAAGSCSLRSTNTMASAGRSICG